MKQELAQETFVFFQDDRLAIRFDHITAVRELSTDDVDGMGGNLPSIPGDDRRPGVSAGATTEITTQKGTYYTSVPFDEVLHLLSQAAIIQIWRAGHPVAIDKKVRPR